MAQKIVRVKHAASGNARRFICSLLLLMCAGNGFAQKHGQALIDSLLQELPRAKQDTGKVVLLNRLGSQYSSINPADGLKYANEGLQLADKLGWPQGISTAYITLGNCRVYLSDYAGARDYWHKAIAICKEQNDKSGILKIIGNIGVVYEYQGDFPRALENHFEALRYAEELGDKRSIALNLGNIGSTYNYLKNQPKALEYNFRALNSFKALRDTASMAIYLGNIGNIYTDQKMWDTSLKYEFAALQYDERAGNNEGIARDLANCGSVYLNTGRYDEALGSFFKSLHCAEKGSFKVTEAKALSSIGDALLTLAHDSAHACISSAVAIAYRIPPNKSELLKSAINYLKQSIAINEAINNLNELQHDYYALSEAQRLAGFSADALASRDKYFALRDSVFSLDSKVKISNLETRRELELKDKQIIIDRLEVAKKRNERAFFIAGIALLLVVAGFIYRNIKLKGAKELSENRLTAFQARMNPHFIFNSLNSIQSLVLNGETINSITYLSRFSKLMRQILDSSAKSKVVLQTELEMLRGYIELEQLRFDAFIYELNVAPGIATESIQVPAMIIQPFVENAIIHGILPKKNDGALRVSFDKEPDHIICTIDDNGIGRKASAALNAERRKDHESHGISIAANRLALLTKNTKGAVTYIDKEEAGIATGTCVILRIPIL